MVPLRVGVYSCLTSLVGLLYLAHIAVMIFLQNFDTAGSCIKGRASSSCTLCLLSPKDFLQNRGWKESEVLVTNGHQKNWGSGLVISCVCACLFVCLYRITCLAVHISACWKAIRWIKPMHSSTLYLDRYKPFHLIVFKSPLICSACTACWTACRNKSICYT